MNDNVLTDVFEELKTTAGSAAKQANPLKVLETGVQQVTGQNPTQAQMPDETWQLKHHQKMISQMKRSDDQNKQAQLSAIRQNLAQMMQPQKSPKQELPKYISGKPGFSEEKIEKQQEEAKKRKLPDLSELLRLKNRGAGERFRGSAG